MRASVTIFIQKPADNLRQKYARYFPEWRKRDYSGPLSTAKVLFRKHRGVFCCAKTRAGTYCKLTSKYPSGRCKFHGGLSTGPRTPEGKRRSALNLKKSIKTS